MSDSGSLVYVPGNAGSVDTVLALLDRNGAIETLNVPPQRYVSPRLSPDGTRLAVESTDEGESVIFVYDLSGSTTMRRLTQTSEGNNGFPVWTPDGERVTFTSDRDGALGIYWQSADGTDVAEALFMAEEDTPFLLPEGWSPDGRTLVFSMGTSSADTNLWTLSLDGGTAADPTLFYGAPNSGQWNASFSPDGNWLAYGSDETGSLEVYVQPFPATGRRYAVTEGDSLRALLSSGPVWSVDGTELFYETILPNQIVAMDVTTVAGFINGTERPLPIEGFFDAPPYRDYDMMPDGQRFLVAFPADQADSGGQSQSQINILLNWFEVLKERVPVP